MSNSGLTCGKCGEAQPEGAKVGSICPRCHARFDDLRWECPPETLHDRVAGVIRLGLKIGLVLIILGAPLAMVNYAMQKRHNEVKKVQDLLANGGPEQRFQAAQELIGKPIASLYQVKTAFIQALNTADDATKINLIRIMPEIDRFATSRAPHAGHVVLPPEWVQALRTASEQASPDVRRAAEEALAGLTQSPGDSKTQPAATSGQ